MVSDNVLKPSSGSLHYLACGVTLSTLSNFMRAFFLWILKTGQCSLGLPLALFSI